MNIIRDILLTVATNLCLTITGKLVRWGWVGLTEGKIEGRELEDILVNHVEVFKCQLC